MENNIYKNDFESFLKESADDFRMIPSRRVWYSIYNNMHPDRRWPSVTVCLIILFAVLYIGISNNNSLSEAARRFNAKNITSPAASQPLLATVSKAERLTGMQRLRKLPVTLNTDEDAAANDYDLVPADVDISSYPKQNDISFSATDDNDNLSDKNKTITIKAGTINLSAYAPAQEEDNADMKKTAALNKKNSELKEAAALQELKNKEAEQTAKQEAAKNIASVNPDKSWVEDYAFRNKPKSKPGRESLSIGYYVTPSFGYRTFYKNDHTVAPNLSLKDAASLNLEAGASLIYKTSKNLRLKTGLQINYTNYISKVTTLEHPMQATLAANRDNNVSRYSEYAVKEGVSRLNKTTLQLSVPVGADIKILGNSKFKWYAGASIQPTYVLSGSSYVLSQDGKNYISETPLLRRWNMNTAVETFVSFRPSNGITVNLGPQFRYQLMSTYRKEYNYSEKLYNIGMKIGVVTGF